MNKRNYQKELDIILSRQNEMHVRVLLHSCCGPCSSSVLEYLTKYFQITLLWYNPNLYPESEFQRRLLTQRELLEKMGLNDSVQMLVEPWQNDAYMAVIRGLEHEPEGGRRCEECFRLRLGRTAELAREGSYDYFCTTLTLSRYKNAELINSIGEEISREKGIAWLPSDFKKQGREMRSSALAKQYNLYQQQYCGCVFSLNRQKKTDKAEKKGRTAADE